MVVKVDHVRAYIVQPDICLKNGIVHYISTILGIADQTIIEYLDQSDSDQIQLRWVIDVNVIF